MKRNANIEKETLSRKTVFLPNSRVLSGEDLTTLSDKEKAFAPGSARIKACGWSSSVRMTAAFLKKSALN